MWNAKYYLKKMEFFAKQIPVEIYYKAYFSQ